jgi:tRNA (uracil-5-)-methyltransferase
MPLSHIDAENYQLQLEAKHDEMQRLFAEHYRSDIQVFPSAPLYYRMRAEFRIWHTNDDMFYAMFRQDDRKTPYRVDQFPVANITINRLMPLLLDSIRLNEVLRRKLFQVEFLSATSGECVVSLIYHRPIDEAWAHEASILAAKLGIEIIGRSRKQKWVLTKDYVIERLKINGHDYYYQQIENSFTQPNHGVCEAMVSWACRQSLDANDDLLELYCGNGNFTLPLARHYRRVLATEISKTSVRSALFNAEQNGIDNLQILRMSSEEFTQAWQGEREFRRLEGVNLNDYRLKTLFVDPPRAGLDEGTTALATHFDKIIYVSCNPQTLARDIAALAKTHRVKTMALFDQFPYTHHAECGAVLEKR